MADDKIKVIVDNRRARHDYFILDTYEAGIALTGTEVKSLRAGKVNLSDSYGMIKDGEMFLEGAHISPYEHGNRYNTDPMRRRKLLLHKRQILKLYGQVKQEGLTLIPLKLYFSKGKVKVDLALCKGKKLYDKRNTEAAKDARREIERATRGRGRSRDE
ncbi:MAG: SsrA-binding protein SmpB [Clostridiales bacterium]|nr:SsrA-binding protein SmpB [Clostridiales bacterium]